MTNASEVPVDRGEIEFGVTLHPQPLPPANVSFNWSVSAGTISAGQGTARITVSIAELPASFVTATVDIGGLDPNCPHTASGTTRIIQDERINRLDNLTELRGIATARVKILEEAGIKTFADLAAVDQNRLKELIPTSTDEDRAFWIAEAKKRVS
jgi:hypothetical protein